MLNREQIEQIEQMINQKVEPLTEEIAALKAQLGKVDLLAVDNRNIRQSLGRIEAAQESLKLDFERQEKRIVHFERQTNDQLTNIKEQLTETDGKVVGLQTEMRQAQKQIDTRFEKVETLLTQILARLPEQ